VRGAFPITAGVALAAIGAVSFGVTTPVIAWAGRDVGPFTTAALLFFLREEPRAHVHVHHEDGEAKVWLERQSKSRETTASANGVSQRRSGSSRSMKMKSAQHGMSTSRVRSPTVSKHGFWLLLEDQELFLPFDEFPWFRDVPIGQLCNVEQPHGGRLYWPELDVDLAVESIRHPERFPLVSRARPNQRM